MKLRKLTVCVDMFGCPNRCKHCWIGHAPNPRLSQDDLRYIAAQFKPYAESFEIFDWYREPEFDGSYRELWELRKELSDELTPHFELASFWRLARDPGYAKWLRELGVGTVQLTLFGGKEMTERYVGRKNAYDEILRAIDVLLENGIMPHIQVFVNKENLGDLSAVVGLIKEKELERRCREAGGEFKCFVHHGSCDGENAKLYDIRITPDDLEKIPPLLRDYTLDYFSISELSEFYGLPEKKLFEELSHDNGVHSYVENSPTFYVDGSFDVFPNITTPSEAWRLGNLKKNGVEAVIVSYLSNKSFGQHTAAATPVSELVRECGDPDSMKLFDRSDYLVYLLNRYADKYRSH